MKKSSCFIQILTYTPPHFKHATFITHYLLRAINSSYTRINTHQQERILATITGRVEEAMGGRHND